ncbi:MAG: hypothetical protein LQ344_000852 [Seirophora lacunosa]|nr:MAG: hypothetical protein LQ344_000852 [Seirophora lacunosa]
MASTQSVQCFGKKKTATAVAHCKQGKGLIKVNGKPLSLTQPEVLRFKVYEPLLIVGLDKFANVDIRVRVTGGGHTSQIYAIRQAIAKSIVAYYQKYVDEYAKNQLKQALVGYDRTLLVADNRSLAFDLPLDDRIIRGPPINARYHKESESNDQEADDLTQEISVQGGRSASAVCNSSVCHTQALSQWFEKSGRRGSSHDNNSPISHNDGSIVKRLLQRIVPVSLILRPLPQYREFLLQVPIEEGQQRYDGRNNSVDERGDNGGEGCCKAIARSETRKGAGLGRKEEVHQAYSNLEHVVAQGKVGKGTPGGLGALLEAGKEALLGVVFKARHLCLYTK